MGIGKVIHNERLEEAVGDKNINVDQYPIGALIDKFGLEATIRGIAYMRSLKEADENYREEVDGNSMKEGYEKAGVSGEEATEEASNLWESKSKEKGLGLDE